MKPNKVHSARTEQSMRSMRSTEGTLIRASTDGGKVLDFDEYLIAACNQFACPFPVIVKKNLQEDDFYKSLKRPENLKLKKLSVLPKYNAEETFNHPEKTDELPGTAPSNPVVDANTIIVEATYDNLNRLAEMSMKQMKHVPRILMQLIGKLAPYYSQLVKISLKRCRIDSYTVYEISKMLPLTSITNICLDGSPFPEGNYVILLNASCQLQHISLSGCLINDEVCGQIASTLYYMAASEATLMTLNLSSNRITDIGAKYLADALRTNRHLRYLNLADNRISDDGVFPLFESLMEFPLTHEEVVNRKLRYMNYLKAKKVLIAKYLKEWDSKSVDENSQVSKKIDIKKKKSSATTLKNAQSVGKEKSVTPSMTEDLFQKAHTLVGEMIGPFADPFSISQTKIKENYTYCVGNMTLCYLNLCYNNLTYLSLKKLHEVILHQMPHKSFNQPGLIKVLVEGNFTPYDCTEINQIKEILNKNLESFRGRSFGDLGARKRTRTARMSVAPALISSSK